MPLPFTKEARQAKFAGWAKKLESRLVTVASRNGAVIDGFEIVSVDNPGDSLGILHSLFSHSVKAGVIFSGKVHGTPFLGVMPHNEKLYYMRLEVAVRLDFTAYYNVRFSGSNKGKWRTDNGGRNREKLMNKHFLKPTMQWGGALYITEGGHLSSTENNQTELVVHAIADTAPRHKAATVADVLKKADRSIQLIREWGTPV